MSVFNPPRLSRGDIQQPAYDRPEDALGFAKTLNKSLPGWQDALRRTIESPVGKYGQLDQEAQADKLRSQSQVGLPPEEHTLDNSDLFDPNAPHMQRLAADRYPSPQPEGASEQGRVQAAATSPANITPGAKSVGKGGIIRDEDMQTQNAGSRLNVQGAGMVDRKVSGRPEFYRMKFYGR